MNTYLPNNNPEELQPQPPLSPQLAYSKILTDQVGQAQKSRQENRINQIYINQMYQEKQRESFPFGKERDRIANYVVQQLNNDQQNNKILEKFRLQAIRNRNQKIMPHYNRQPYVTESMLPGTHVDPTKLIQRSIPSISPDSSIRLQPIQSTIVNKSKTLNYVEKEKKSIGVITEDAYLIKSSRKQLRRKKERELHNFYEEDEQQSFQTIKRMLNNINSKIKKNTSAINESMERQTYYKKANFFKAPKRRILTYETEEQEKKKPRIEYSLKRNRMKTQEIKLEDMSEVKKHLLLLKRNRKRLYNLYEQSKK